MFENSPSLVHQYLTRSARDFPDKCALVFGSARWSFSEIDGITDNLALELRNAGLERGDRVVIFLDNCPETVFAIYAVLKAGGVFVPLGGGLKAQKLAYILRDASPRILITHGTKSEEVARAWHLLGKKIQTMHFEESNHAGSREIKWRWSDDAGNGGNHGFPSRPNDDLSDPRLIDQDLAALIYTSSSTGEPKGIMAPHCNMIAVAGSIIKYLGNRPEDVVAVTLPLSFDYGLYQVLMAFMYGGTVILERSFLFPAKILEVIARERVTGLPIVPTASALLLQMDSFSRYDLSSLRYITSTGASLPEKHIRRLRECFPGVEIFSMFGLTECKRVCYLPPGEIDRIPGSVGKPIPGCEVFLVGENGNEVGTEEVGEMVVRGSNVMRGYWNAPETTAKTFREWRFKGEKLLFSGDLFRKDRDGFLFFLGRKDDLIKIKGHLVSPREVENAVCAIDGVLEASVIGVEDDILGKAVKAFVVVAPGRDLRREEILRQCKMNLEAWMVPKFVQFLPSLPKNFNGKIDKSALKNLEDSSRENFSAGPTPPFPIQKDPVRDV